MGLLYTNPIIPIGSASLFSLFIINKNNFRSKKKYLPQYILLFLTLIFFGYGFSLHLWWQEMASSYGYRYLLQLFPIALMCAFILLFYIKQYNVRYSKFFRRFIIFFSSISIVSMVFFETSENLKLHKSTNTFGVEREYSANGYMINLPSEIIKPVIWIKLIGRSTLSFICSPIISKFDLLNNNSFLYAIINENYGGTLKKDFNKYKIRILKKTHLFHIGILLLLWIFGGNILNKYITTDKKK